MSGSGGCLVLSTRGIKARHRHLLRDVLRLLPHANVSSKLDTQDGLGSVCQLCEDQDCSTALLLDARDPRRLYLWAANCPDGPSIMFRVMNVHTVAELKFDARRVNGVRNLLVFDVSFSKSPEKQVIQALLTRAFSVPAKASRKAQRLHAVRHAISFSWLEGGVWVRVFRIDRSEIDQEKIELNEIGPRFVLMPVRIISGGFYGAILSGA
eukprot:6141971-Pleurochrysis_carterae.AAC.1